MSMSVITAVNALENQINQGAFGSQLEWYLDTMFRHSNLSAWYQELAASDGVAAAENKLGNFVRARHYGVISTQIEPVARGILALAKADPDNLVDVSWCTSTLMGAIDPFEPRHKFVVYNTAAPGCGCMQPQGSDVFGPGGSLGLKAVILETGTSRRGPLATVSLVLPAWGTAKYMLEPGEFTVAELHSTGDMRGARYMPYVVSDGKAVAFDDTDVALRRMIGMESMGDMDVRYLSSSIDQVIGFPGAEDYLAAKLPQLGDYFVALAAKLTTPHTH